MREGKSAARTITGQVVVVPTQRDSLTTDSALWKPYVGTEDLVMMQLAEKGFL